MKCPTCESCEYAQYCGATEIMRKCERHNKKVQMTNEEWLRTASTEELAEFICGKIVCYECPVLDRCEAKFNGECDKKLWAEWLKQESE